MWIVRWAKAATVGSWVTMMIVLPAWLSRITWSICEARKRFSFLRMVSGEPIRPLYTDSDLPADPEAAIGLPGEYPYTRGVYPSMYRGRLWTMRQFAGFGTVEETNERFHYLLDHGQTGLSTAFGMSGNTVALAFSGSYGPPRPPDNTRFDASTAVGLGLGNPVSGLGVELDVNLTSFRHFGASGNISGNVSKMFQINDKGVYSVMLAVGNLGASM